MSRFPNSDRQMLDVLGVQPNELQEVWYVLDDGDNCLNIKDSELKEI